jgi:hypothetical protein
MHAVPTSPLRQPHMLRIPVERGESLMKRRTVADPTGLFFDQRLPYRTALPGHPLVGGSWHHSSECGPA